MLIMLSVHGRDLPTIYYLRLLHPQLGWECTCKNNVTYLTHIILFTFLCSLAGVRAHALSELFYLLGSRGVRGNNYNNIIGIRG